MKPILGESGTAAKEENSRSACCEQDWGTKNIRGPVDELYEADLPVGKNRK
jgi:hypothetical protein